MRRREFLTGLTVAGLRSAAAFPIVCPLAARAQQRPLPVIGYLFAGSPDLNSFMLNSFRKGLSDSGFVEGRNVAIEYRWAEDRLDRLPALAAELVLRQVSVLVASASTAAALAAKSATRTIPVVFLMGSDPVEIGLVDRFNRPGGNVTGVAILAGEIAAKRLDLLHKLIPTATSIALLVNPANRVIAQVERRNTESAADILGMRLLVLNAGTADELAAAFATLVDQRAGALLVGNDVFFNNSAAAQIIALAARHAVSAMYFDSASVEAGGLVSYGPDLVDAHRQIGLYTARILKGEKPADLPVVQPTRFEFVINLQTAKQLGLTLPPNVLALTDRVIE